MPAVSPEHLRTLLRRRTYWHVMPTFRQAKLTGAWDTLKEISRGVPGAKPNESELRIDYPNGSRIQLIGADNPDSLRGPGLSGLSLDEYSQIPPNAFGEVLSKALADHVGYAIFSGTIKGTDQLYDTYEASKTDPDWFSLWQNVDQSLDTEQGATIEALRRAMDDDRKLVVQGLMSEAEFDQEWYLSPEAAIKGAFYGGILKKLREQGHITHVPYDPTIPVDTDWDLGIDAMAIWFSQSTKSGEIRLIDYHENVGGGLPESIKVVREKGYIYGTHWAPHDIEVREISSGLSRRQAARSLGISFNVTPMLAVPEGINAVQMLLPRCYFDEMKCKAGLEALRAYRRTHNQRLDQFTEQPMHDWASHGADAMRGLAVRYRKPIEAMTRPVVRRPVLTAWS